MDDLSVYDTKQLEDELERRKKERAEKAKPQPVDNPDWSKVQNVCQEYIDKLESGYPRHELEHYTYYIFEVAMKESFGVEVFEWVSEQSG